MYNKKEWQHRDLITKEALNNIENGISELDDKVSKLENDLTVNVKNFGAIGNGTSDDTIFIQNAINYAKQNGKSEVFFPAGEYNISNTITVPEEITINLSGGFNTDGKHNWQTNDNTAVVYIVDDVIGFELKSKSNILGGVISTIKYPNYSSSCIRVCYNGDDSVLWVSIKTSLRGRAKYDNTHGTAIEVYTDNNGGGHLFNLLIDCNIEAFDIGVHTHKNVNGTGNAWFSNLMIDGNIVNCVTAIKNEFGGNGGFINATIQPLLVSQYNRTDDPLMLLYAHNMKITGMFWDLGDAINTLPIHNYGNNNIIISTYELKPYLKDFSKNNGTAGLVQINNYISNPYNLPNSSKNIGDIRYINGNQDNLLLGGNKRYKIIEDKQNVVVGGGGLHLLPTGMWEANASDTYMALKDTSTSGTYILEIELDSVRGVKNVGVTFAKAPYSCKIELFSNKINDYVTVYDNKIEDIYASTNGMLTHCYWEYNYMNDYATIGNYYEWNVSKIRYTFVLNPESEFYGNNTCEISSLFAYDGSINVLGYYGGSMYGDIKFVKNGIGVILTSPDGTNFRLSIDNEGNITSTRI